MDGLQMLFDVVALATRRGIDGWGCSSWKQTFGSRGRPQSPAHGGKEALTECEAVPLCLPHRTSHLGWGVREHSPHDYLNNKEGQKVVHPFGQKDSLLSVYSQRRLRTLVLLGCHFLFSHPLKLEWRHSSVSPPLHNYTLKCGGVVFTCLWAHKS